MSEEIEFTPEELSLLQAVVTSFNDGGAFPEGTEDFEIWEDIVWKVERGYYKVHVEDS